jgi:hypothetical protein
MRISSDNPSSNCFNEERQRADAAEVSGSLG